MVPLIFVIIAITQIYLQSHYFLSSWTGGGFGMFASNDYPSKRRIELSALVNNQYLKTEIPHDLTYTFHMISIFPHPLLIKQAAKRINEKEWIIEKIKINNKEMAFLKSINEDEKGQFKYQFLIKHLVIPKRLKIQIDRLHFNTEQLSISYTSVTNFNIPLKKI